MRSLLAILALGLSMGTALAVEPDEMLKDPALEARARAITRELRCVVCQNQSVDDSDAPLAHDIRVLVRERIAQGDSDEQARGFIVARYGDFVLLRPPFRGDTLVLWLGPLVLLGVGGILAWRYIRRVGQLGYEVTPLSPKEEEDVRRLVDGEPS